MYTLPVSDTLAIAVDDADEDIWWVHFVNFQTRGIESFSVDGLGHVQSAHYDTGRDLLWVIVEGTIFAIQRAEKEIFEVPMPEPEFYAYAMTGEGAFVYVGGEYSNIWRIALPDLEWEPLLTPERKPPRAKDDAAQTRNVLAYAEKYPPYYFGFPVGNDFLFCGALGALALVHGRAVETQSIDTGARFVTGHVAGDSVALSADSPKAEIYLGTFREGLEVIFSDTLAAFHRTAMHAGRRYIGVADYPPSKVHNLYLHDNPLPVPVETGCAREPMPLISLSTKGSALWAIDALGMFRLSEGTWQLVEIEDLRAGVWPAAE